MNFSPNKTPIEVIREGAFGGTYFRDVYSGINVKWHKNSWKEFLHLKNTDANFMHQIIMIKILINTKLKQEHHYSVSFLFCFCFLFF